MEQVAVQRGAVQGDALEVFGALQEGDLVARRGTEDLRPGARVSFKTFQTTAGGAP